MADFLTRLAERTLGVVPVAQPIIAPMFAPGPTMMDSMPEAESWGESLDETQVPHPQQTRQTQQTFSHPASSPLVPHTSQPSVVSRQPVHKTADMHTAPQSSQSLKGGIGEGLNKTADASAASAYHSLPQPLTRGEVAPPQTMMRRESRQSVPPVGANESASSISLESVAAISPNSFEKDEPHFTPSTSSFSSGVSPSHSDFAVRPVLSETIGTTVRPVPSATVSHPDSDFSSPLRVSEREVPQQADVPAYVQENAGSMVPARNVPTIHREQVSITSTGTGQPQNVGSMGLIAPEIVTEHVEAPHIVPTRSMQPVVPKTTTGEVGAQFIAPEIVTEHVETSHIVPVSSTQPITSQMMTESVGAPHILPSRSTQVAAPEVVTEHVVGQFITPEVVTEHVGAQFTAPKITTENLGTPHTVPTRKAQSSPPEVVTEHVGAMRAVPTSNVHLDTAPTFVTEEVETQVIAPDEVVTRRQQSILPGVPDDLQQQNPSNVKPASRLPVGQRLLVPEVQHFQSITHHVYEHMNKQTDLAAIDEQRVKNVETRSQARSTLERDDHKPTDQRSDASTANAATSTPTIRVTIGRIDVRAVTPTPPASAGNAKPSRPGPRLSLDDYLKQQKGGER